ncbi:hypothetical protein THRCLA_05046 [Thraustotheca clavata]|uniref:Uncharacterized protein n=1 Tax=Thraustotheca clavata TaxID=74557 RepID=A0A1V9ZX49_9STRA|nr:hypothetical protein THRCLA_05046 [Thraustotheca clavata]
MTMPKGHLRSLKNTIRSRAVEIFNERERKTSSTSSTSSLTVCSSPNGGLWLAVKVVSPRSKIKFKFDMDEDEKEYVRPDNGFVLVRGFNLDPRRWMTGKRSGHVVRALIRANMIDCLSCKWAPSYFSYISQGVALRQLTVNEANSLRWLVCQYIIAEAQQRSATQIILREQLTRKLTDFRIAVQCVSGLTVVKYGRKGKPHSTQLLVENADTIRWTPKIGTQLQSVLRPISKKERQKFIQLSTVISIQTGFSSEVFRKAVAKKAPLDPSCCLSLITPTRSLDMVVKNAQECDWLRRSFEMMVAQAQENEKKASAHVETTIMKKLGTFVVLKYGRKGNPHRTRLNLDKYGEVTWKGKSGGSILLQEVKELRLGHGTSVFQRLASKSNPKHCLSLITPSRSLDLEMNSESERDYVVLAFRYLLNKMKDRAREAKRMKAERGVRMLQEAYQYHAKRMSQLSQATPHYDLERYPGASPDVYGLEKYPGNITAPSSPMGLERYAGPEVIYPPLKPTSPIVERYTPPAIASERYASLAGFSLERPPQITAERYRSGFPATVSMRSGQS